MIRSLWSEPKTTFRGRFYNLDNEPMSPKLQQPMPIWMGSAIRTRCAAPPGSLTVDGPRVGRASPPFPVRPDPQRGAGAGRDPANFPISKRIFMAVDERPEVARASPPLVHRGSITTPRGY